MPAQSIRMGIIESGRFWPLPILYGDGPPNLTVTSLEQF
jgi:hypothetical protein